MKRAIGVILAVIFYGLFTWPSCFAVTYEQAALRYNSLSGQEQEEYVLSLLRDFNATAPGSAGVLDFCLGIAEKKRLTAADAALAELEAEKLRELPRLSGRVADTRRLLSFLRANSGLGLRDLYLRAIEQADPHIKEWAIRMLSEDNQQNQSYLNSLLLRLYVDKAAEAPLLKQMIDGKGILRSENMNPSFEGGFADRPETVPAGWGVDKAGNTVIFPALGANSYNRYLHIRKGSGHPVKLTNAVTEFSGNKPYKIEYGFSARAAVDNPRVILPAERESEWPALAEIKAELLITVEGGLSAASHSSIVALPYIFSWEGFKGSYVSARPIKSCQLIITVSKIRDLTAAGDDDRQAGEPAQVCIDDAYVRRQEQEFNYPAPVIRSLRAPAWAFSGEYIILQADIVNASTGIWYSDLEGGALGEGRAITVRLEKTGLHKIFFRAKGDYGLTSMSLPAGNDFPQVRVVKPAVSLSGIDAGQPVSGNAALSIGISGLEGVPQGALTAQIAVFANNKLLDRLTPAAAFRPSYRYTLDTARIPDGLAEAQARVYFFRNGRQAYEAESGALCFNLNNGGSRVPFIESPLQNAALSAPAAYSGEEIELPPARGAARLAAYKSAFDSQIGEAISILSGCGPYEMDDLLGIARNAVVDSSAGISAAAGDVSDGERNYFRELILADSALSREYASLRPKVRAATRAFLDNLKILLGIERDEDVPAWAEHSSLASRCISFWRPALDKYAQSPYRNNGKADAEAALLDTRNRVIINEVIQFLNRVKTIIGDRLVWKGGPGRPVPAAKLNYAKLAAAYAYALAYHCQANIICGPNYLLWERSKEEYQAHVDYYDALQQAFARSAQPLPLTRYLATWNNIPALEVGSLSDTIISRTDWQQYVSRHNGSLDRYIAGWPGATEHESWPESGSPLTTRGGIEPPLFSDEANLEAEEAAGSGEPSAIPLDSLTEKDLEDIGFSQQAISAYLDARQARRARINQAGAALRQIRAARDAKLEEIRARYTARRVGLPKLTIICDGPLARPSGRQEPAFVLYAPAAPAGTAYRALRWTLSATAARSKRWVPYRVVSRGQNAVIITDVPGGYTLQLDAWYDDYSFQSAAISLIDTGKHILHIRHEGGPEWITLAKYTPGAQTYGKPEEAKSIGGKLLENFASEAGPYYAEDALHRVSFWEDFDQETKELIGPSELFSPQPHTGANYLFAISEAGNKYYNGLFGATSLHPWQVSGYDRETNQLVFDRSALNPARYRWDLSDFTLRSAAAVEGNAEITITAGSAEIEQLMLPGMAAPSKRRSESYRIGQLVDFYAWERAQGQVGGAFGRYRAANGIPDCMEMAAAELAENPSSAGDYVRRFSRETAYYGEVLIEQPDTVRFNTFSDYFRYNLKHSYCRYGFTFNYHFESLLRHEFFHSYHFSKVKLDRAVDEDRDLLTRGTLNGFISYSEDQSGNWFRGPVSADLGFGIARSHSINLRIDGNTDFANIRLPVWPKNEPMPIKKVVLRKAVFTSERGRKEEWANYFTVVLEGGQSVEPKAYLRPKNEKASARLKKYRGELKVTYAIVTPHCPAEYDACKQMLNYAFVGIY